MSTPTEQAMKAAEEIRKVCAHTEGHALAIIIDLATGLPALLAEQEALRSSLTKLGALYEQVDAERERLRAALESSVKLQSHYAELLNIWDGGNRMQFNDAAAWLARLDFLAASKAVNP